MFLPPAPFQTFRCASSQVRHQACKYPSTMQRTVRFRRGDPSLGDMLVRWDYSLRSLRATGSCFRASGENYMVWQKPLGRALQSSASGTHCNSLSQHRHIPANSDNENSRLVSPTDASLSLRSTRNLLQPPHHDSAKQQHISSPVGEGNISFFGNLHFSFVALWLLY